MVLKQRKPLRLLGVVLAAAVCFVLPATAQARTIKVAPTGNTQAIQDAVNAAAPGDTILVAPGTYSGPTIHVKTSGLTITGSRIDSTLADGINFHRNITNSSVTQTVIRGTGDDGLAMWRRRHVGFVFQAYDLLPFLSVAENVQLQAGISGRTGGVDVDELLERLGLGGEKDKLPDQLSGLPGADS